MPEVDPLSIAVHHLLPVSDFVPRRIHPGVEELGLETAPSATRLELSSPQDGGALGGGA